MRRGRLRTNAKESGSEQAAATGVINLMSIGGAQQVMLRGDGCRGSAKLGEKV